MREFKGGDGGGCRETVGGSENNNLNGGIAYGSCDRLVMKKERLSAWSSLIFFLHR